MRHSTYDCDTRGCGRVIIGIGRVLSSVSGRLGLDVNRALPEGARMRGGWHGRAAASFYVARGCRNAGHLVAGGNILLGQRN